MSQSVIDWIGPAILRYHAQHHGRRDEWVKSHDPAQVIRFDSYRRPNDSTDQSQIQAVISDRVHRIVVLFEPTATTAKEESTKEPLTSHLRCILAFQSYRFALVPSLSLPKAPTSESPADLTLVLEVRDWMFMGGSKSEPEYYENSRMLSVGGAGGREDWEIEGVIEKWVGEFRSQENYPTYDTSSLSFPQSVWNSSMRPNPPQSQKLLSSPRTICSIIRPLLETTTADPLPPGHDEVDRAAWVFEIAGGEEGRKVFQGVVAGIGVWGMDVDGDEAEGSVDEEVKVEGESDIRVAEEEQPSRVAKERTPSTSDEDEQAIPWSPSPPIATPKPEVIQKPEIESIGAVKMSMRRVSVVAQNKEHSQSPPTRQSPSPVASSPIQSQALQASSSPHRTEQDLNKSPLGPDLTLNETQASLVQGEGVRDAPEEHAQLKIEDIPPQSLMESESAKQELADNPGDSDEIVGASFPDEETNRPSLFDPSPNLKPVVESLTTESTESLELLATPDKEQETTSLRCRVRSPATRGSQTFAPVPMASPISPRPSPSRQGADDGRDEETGNEEMEEVGSSRQDMIVKPEVHVPQAISSAILAMDSDGTASGQSQSQGEIQRSRHPSQTQKAKRGAAAPKAEPPLISRHVDAPRPASTKQTASTESHRQLSPPSPTLLSVPTTQTNLGFLAPTLASSSKKLFSMSKEDRRRSLSRQPFTPKLLPAANKSSGNGQDTELSLKNSQSHIKIPSQPGETAPRHRLPTQTRSNPLKRYWPTNYKPELKRRRLTIELGEEEDGLLIATVHKVMTSVAKKE